MWVLLRKTARRGLDSVPSRRRRIRSWRLRRAAPRLATWVIPLIPSLLGRGDCLHYFLPPILPALPALRRICSPAYRTPLPLYGSGLRVERTFAAISPTSSLSIPTTANRVGFSTSKEIPFGGSISI